MLKYTGNGFFGKIRIQLFCKEFRVLQTPVLFINQNFIDEYIKIFTDIYSNLVNLDRDETRKEE